MIRRDGSPKLPWRDLRRSSGTIRGRGSGFAATSASVDFGRSRLFSVTGTGQAPLHPRPTGSKESRLTQALNPQRDPSCLPYAVARPNRRPVQRVEAAAEISSGGTGRISGCSRQTGRKQRRQPNGQSTAPCVVLVRLFGSR